MINRQQADKHETTNEEKGGKGDGRGAYHYPDGMQLGVLMSGDDVSGHQGGNECHNPDLIGFN